MNTLNIIKKYAKQIPKTPYFRFKNGEINFTENEWLQIVKRNGFAIQNIKTPSEEVQLAAVKKSGYAIAYIKNPSIEVQLEAVKRSRHAIQHIKTPTEEIKLAAKKQMKTKC